MAMAMYDDSKQPDGLMKKEPLGYSLTLSCLVRNI